MTELANFINTQINISEEELKIILSHFEERIIDKDKYLIRKGQPQAQNPFDSE